MTHDRSRPTQVYCNGYRPKEDQLGHELAITEFFLHGYRQAEDIRRGWDTDRAIRPDAEFTLEGVRFLLELDTGTESHPQVVRRQKQAYGDVHDYVLYVTTRSQRRVQGLVKHSERVKDIALFATLDAVLEDPSGEVWIDAYGERVAIWDGID